MQNKRILILENAAQLQPFSFAAVKEKKKKKQKTKQTCARVHELFLSFFLFGVSSSVSFSIIAMKNAKAHIAYNDGFIYINVIHEH